jgi:hypothetical protein
MFYRVGRERVLNDLRGADARTGVRVGGREVMI